MKFRINRKTAIAAATAAMTASTLLAAPQANAAEVTYHKDAQRCTIVYDQADHDRYAELEGKRFQAQADVFYDAVPGLEEIVRPAAEQGRLTLRAGDFGKANDLVKENGYSDPWTIVPTAALRLQREANKEHTSSLEKGEWGVDKTNIALELTGLSDALKGNIEDFNATVNTTDKTLQNRLVVAYRTATVELDGPRKDALRKCASAGSDDDVILSAASISSGDENSKLEEGLDKAKSIGIGVGVGAAFFALLMLIGSFSPVWYPELQKAMNR
ncbi:hypothetical protein [Corynebacterium frankenforstense]